MTSRIGTNARALISRAARKGVLLAVLFVFAARGLAGASAPHVRLGVVSDWTLVAAKPSPPNIRLT